MSALNSADDILDDTAEDEEPQTNRLADVVRMSGKVVRDGAEVIIIFKANGKYYPATDANSEVMDAYLHTGDPVYLSQFENEVEL